MRSWDGSWQHDIVSMGNLQQTSSSCSNASCLQMQGMIVIVMFILTWLVCWCNVSVLIIQQSTMPDNFMPLQMKTGLLASMLWQSKLFLEQGMVSITHQHLEVLQVWDWFGFTVMSMVDTCKMNEEKSLPTYYNLLHVVFGNAACFPSASSKHQNIFNDTVQEYMIFYVWNILWFLYLWVPRSEWWQWSTVQKCWSINTSKMNDWNCLQSNSFLCSQNDVNTIKWKSYPLHISIGNLHLKWWTSQSIKYENMCMHVHDSFWGNQVLFWL